MLRATERPLPRSMFFSILAAQEAVSFLEHNLLKLSWEWWREYRYQYQDLYGDSHRGPFPHSLLSAQQWKVCVGFNSSHSAENHNEYKILPKFLTSLLEAALSPEPNPYPQNLGTSLLPNMWLRISEAPVFRMYGAIYPISTFPNFQQVRSPKTYKQVQSARAKG